MASSSKFSISSSAFKNKGEIPSEYTCEGKNVSPPLSWKGAPSNTKSFALIVDDPDAPDPDNPKTTWVHWVLYNIPADHDSLPEDPSRLATGALEGRNDWHERGYGGPCPPIGRHRYFFKLYALDTTLPDLEEPTKDELEESMRGHILAEAILIGTYVKHVEARKEQIKSI